MWLWQYNRRHPSHCLVFATMFSRVYNGSMFVGIFLSKDCRALWCRSDTVEAEDMIIESSKHRVAISDKDCTRCSWFSLLSLTFSKLAGKTRVSPLDASQTMPS